MDNYCCKNVDNVDKNMRQRRHQIHDNLGVPTGGRGTQGRGTRQMLRIHQCMYSCLIWRMIRLWLEERLKPRTRASQGKFF